MDLFWVPVVSCTCLLSVSIGLLGAPRCLWVPISLFWGPIGLFWMPIGLFPVPMGLIWVPIGLFWVPLGLFWVPVGLLHVPIGLLGVSACLRARESHVSCQLQTNSQILGNPTAANLSENRWAKQMNALLFYQSDQFVAVGFLRIWEFVCCWHDTWLSHYLTWHSRDLTRHVILDWQQEDIYVWLDMTLICVWHMRWHSCVCNMWGHRLDLTLICVWQDTYVWLNMTLVCVWHESDMTRDTHVTWQDTHDFHMTHMWLDNMTNDTQKRHIGT